MDIFAFFDKKMGKYVHPFFAPNPVSALRGVQASLKESNIMSEHPADFVLMKVGFFKDDEGIVVATPNPTALDELVNLMPKKGGQ